MKICRLSRPPIRSLYKQFPQTRDFLLNHLEKAGHEILEFPIQPLGLQNRYLSYGLAILPALFRFRNVKPDVILADNIETGLTALLIKSAFHTPFVFNFLDDYSLIASYDPWKIRHGILKAFEKTVPRSADLVIVVDSMKRDFCLDCGIPKSKIRMVPNGADTARFGPRPADPGLRKALGLKEGKIILFVGKINRYYRLDNVLKAVPAVLSKAPGTQFLLVGDGDALTDLRHLCHQLGIERAVTFAGFHPPEKIPEIINLSDLCVFPLPDSSALALFEYMACAKPVVLAKGGTRKMGVPVEMIPEQCALRVDPSPQGMARGILDVLDHPGAAMEMGRRAKEFVDAFHDWNRLSDRYAKCIEELHALKTRSPICPVQSRSNHG